MTLLYVGEGCGDINHCSVATAISLLLLETARQDTYRAGPTGTLLHPEHYVLKLSANCFLYFIKYSGGVLTLAVN